MKRIYQNLLWAAAAVMISSAASSQALLSPRVMADSKDMQVEYGQPSKRGRIIFGALVPYDEVWRTGANDVTVITLRRDALFGDKPVKKGDYVLFTRPGKEKWLVILNSEMNQWGANDYEVRTKEMDVVRVEIPAEKTNSVVEQLSIRPADDSLIIEWDQTRVRIPVTFK